MKTDSGSPSESTATTPAAEVESFYTLHRPEIFGTLLYMLGDAEDAADAFQDSFIKCWKHVDQVQELRDLRAWIFRIVINTARDARRQTWRRRKKTLDSEMTAQLTSSSDPEAETVRRRQLVALRVQIGELPEVNREIFLLRQNGSLTYDEIAELLDLPVGTVKTRMRSAVLRLREALFEE